MTKTQQLAQLNERLAKLEAVIDSLTQELQFANDTNDTPRAQSVNERLAIANERFGVLTRSALSIH